MPVTHFAPKMKIWKKIFFWFQGGSNPWPQDYWPDALTSWAMFFQNPIIFIKLSIIRFIERTKIDIRGQWDHFLGWVKLPYSMSNNEQFLLRIIGLCWPIFQWSRFFSPQYWVMLFTFCAIVTHILFVLWLWLLLLWPYAHCGKKKRDHWNIGQHKPIIRSKNCSLYKAIFTTPKNGLIDCGYRFLFVQWSE